MDKSYVRVLLKSGVSKGGSTGFEVETKLCKGDSGEELKELGEKALKVTFDLYKHKV